MLNFNQASILGYNHKSEFFGDNIRYKCTKDITVEGLITNFSNLSGISGIITGISGFEASAQDWHIIQINNISFGSGTITNINFDEGNDVQKKKYTVNLSLYETGASGNFPTGSNTYYSGINWASFCEVESLDENISFNNDFEKSTYNHNINVRILSSNITGSINSAKTIASNLFNANNLTGFSGQYYSLGNVKSYYTESYDLLTAECSFNKRIEILSNISGNYSIAKTYVFNRDEAGIANVSEKGQIKALQRPYEPILYSAATNEMSNSYSNCSGVFNYYQESNNYSLFNLPLVKGTNLNSFEGVLDYEVIFTNNLNENTNYFWTYAHEFSLDEKGLIVSAENGQIIGRGNLSSGKYNLAVNGYDSISGAISTRANTLYNNYLNITDITLPTPSQFILVKKNEVFSDHLGAVNYNWSFSNDSTLAGPPFVKTDISVSDEYRVPLTHAVIVPGFMEVEQNRGNQTVGHKKVTINIRGTRNTTFDQFLTQAKSLASAYSLGNIDSATYSYSPTRNQFTFDITYPRYT